MKTLLGLMQHGWRSFIPGLDLANKLIPLLLSQPAFTCSKLTIETLQQGVKNVQS